MKKFALSLIFTIVTLVSFATFNYYRITGAATVLVAPQDQADYIYIYASPGPVTLLGDWTINLTAPMPAGTHFVACIDVSNVNLNGHNISFYGYNLTANQAAVLGQFDVTFVSDHSGGVAGYYSYKPLLLEQAQQLDGITLIDGTVSPSALSGSISPHNLDSLGQGRIFVGGSDDSVTSLYAAGNAKLLIGDGSDLNSVSMSGDATITNGGTVAISAGVIVNADVNAAAAIARTKIASGSASFVLINDGAGVMSSEATLNPARGGLGANVSGSTGFVTFSAGSSTVGAINEAETFEVSFEAGEQCNNRFKMPCAGTVTGFYAVCTKAISGTDNGTIILKNAAGTTMATGTITFTASDPLETAYNVTPSTNNTFSAGDILYAVTAKTTDGGKALVTITYSRSN